jgi:ribosomal protein S18 acetylase RimI-like enzyme
VWCRELYGLARRVIRRAVLRTRLMNDVAIRKATRDDIDAIQRLYRQLDRHHVELLSDVFQPVDGDARTADVVAKFIADEDADYLVAERGKEIVGFLNVQKRSHPPFPMFRPHHFAMIENAVVDKPHRGQSIGTALFDAAIRWAKDKGLTSIQTTVWTANDKARGFYVDHGFRPMTEKLELNLAGMDAEQRAGADGEDAAAQP